ncbi:P-loop containing nucleoside triphosphate hydrolase protein [Phlyctochytrium arcticum]|nr:P-loop containing nucleoside triphosphate hydrolase protein [Phlyctochytrium arcticum]
MEPIYLKVKAVHECQQYVVWCDRSRGRLSSGQVVCLEFANRSGARVPAKVQIYSKNSDVFRNTSIDVTHAENPKDPRKLFGCVLSSGVAKSLGCTTGDEIVLVNSVQPAGIPRAKKVCLSAHPSHAPFALRVIGKPYLADWKRAADIEVSLHGEFLVEGQHLTFGNESLKVVTIDRNGKPGHSAFSPVRVDEHTKFEFCQNAGHQIVHMPACDYTRWANMVSCVAGGVTRYIQSLIEEFMLFRSQSVRSSRSGHLRTKKCSFVLLTGCVGVGKTLLARSFAGCSQLPWRFVRCADLLSIPEGDAEFHFLSAIDGQLSGPSLLVLDEIDIIASMDSSGDQRGAKSRLFDLLLNILNGSLAHMLNQQSIFVIGTTNRMDIINPALLQSNVMTRSLDVIISTPQQRAEILTILCQKLPLDPPTRTQIITRVSEATHGFVGSDLRKLIHSAFTAWEHRLELARLPRDTPMCFEDFATGLQDVRPATLNDAEAVDIPPKHFSDLFGMNNIISRIHTAVLSPLRNMTRYAALGVRNHRGLLIHGVSGVGKSVLSYALVNESGFNCVYVEGAKLRSKVVGESEQNIAKIFAKARASAPSILLIDQIDMIVPRRGLDNSSENTGERIVTCFLTEMDGILSASETGASVFVVAATSRPEVVDEAILRPGRLDEHILIPVPDAQARKEILDGFLRTIPHSLQSDDLNQLVTLTEGCTGADIENVCREAALSRLRIDLNSTTVHPEDFFASFGTLYSGPPGTI